MNVIHTFLEVIDWAYVLIFSVCITGIIWNFLAKQSGH